MSIEKENLINIEYSDVMRQSYIDYAMSVIVSRAIPDIRDGLKPVQRRILYDMYELGLRYDRPFKKCARVVGDTMGKYHPHGDSSIYEALVVMAQDFKKGEKLVDGHGNFGSIEGDMPAAMRYTECRLREFSIRTMLSDLDKNVINFIPNFDESLEEPEVLPALIPNILINGSEGIAVGMTTSIPPHNIGEVIEALRLVLRNREASLNEVMKIIKGPDFPTGGIIINKNDLEDIYEKGCGKLKLRGKIEIEELKNTKQLVITEIPYTMIGNGINKLQNDIYKLVETKLTTDIVDISNQSNKDGIRIVIEIKKNTDTDRLINLIYNKTRLEDSMSVNMLSVVDNRPMVLGLLDILNTFADFRIDLCKRKHENLLKKELEKKEVQEGLLIAIDIIDTIIELLRGSKNVKDARVCLMSGDTSNISFKNKESEILARDLHFTERQASAILDMKFQRLIGLELMELRKSYEECLNRIKELEGILKNNDSLVDKVDEELLELKKKFSRKRRTGIQQTDDASNVTIDVVETDIVVLIDRLGYVKSVDPSTFERNKEAAVKENVHFIMAKNTDKLAMFTNTGKLLSIRCMDIPFGRYRDRSVPLDTISSYDSASDRIVLVKSFKEIEDRILIFLTMNGYIKRCTSDEFNMLTKRSMKAIGFNPEDILVSVLIADKSKDNIVIETNNGFFLHFLIDEIHLQKRMAKGAKAIRLEDGDYVKTMYIFEGSESIKSYDNLVLENDNYSLSIDEEETTDNPANDSVIIYNDKELYLNKIRLSKRGCRGSKPLL